MNSLGRRFAVYADCNMSGKPVEVSSIEQQKNRLVLASGDDVLDDAKTAMLQSTKSLPFFAEAYNISADPRDYVMVPVVIMPSELPNRNAVGFPYTELTKANPELGMLGYQTWANKPTFTDHNNQDHTKAKGIIFAASLRPMPQVQGGLWKVICLCGFDRTRDPILVNSILSGERNSYSMGAWTSYFTCSACGAAHPKQACEHINMQKPQLSVQANGELTYLQARDILGFEVSSVVVPAFTSAESDTIMQWGD